MQIRDLTRTKADYMLCACNFTPDEETLFELRLQDVSLEDCAEKMQMSTATISRLHKRVIDKIKEES
jgi:predicted DNA-binding protein (UPF0251 family)